jgi:hypothetical protein
MANELLNNLFEQDALAPVIPTDSELTDISSLVAEQLRLEDLVAAKEAELKELCDKLRKISEVGVPEAMAAAGIKTFTTSNGGKVTIKESVFASLKDDGLSWLETNGLSGIIKDEIKFSFGKGEGDLAQKVMAFASKEGLDPAEKRTVHPSTLNATIKKLLESGTEPPESAISYAIVKKSVIKSGVAK